jgi:protein TonB
MSYVDLQQSTSQRATGFMMAIMLHIIIGYALVNGHARWIIDVLQILLQTKVIEELKPPFEASVPRPAAPVT